MLKRARDKSMLPVEVVLYRAEQAGYASQAQLCRAADINTSTLQYWITHGRTSQRNHDKIVAKIIEKEREKEEARRHEVTAEIMRRLGREEPIGTQAVTLF